MRARAGNTRDQRAPTGSMPPFRMTPRLRAGQQARKSAGQSRHFRAGAVAYLCEYGNTGGAAPFTGNPPVEGSSPEYSFVARSRGLIGGMRSPALPVQIYRDLIRLVHKSMGRRVRRRFSFPQRRPVLHLASMAPVRGRLPRRSPSRPRSATSSMSAGTRPTWTRSKSTSKSARRSGRSIQAASARWRVIAASPLQGSLCAGQPPYHPERGVRGAARPGPRAPALTSVVRRRDSQLRRQLAENITHNLHEDDEDGEYEYEYEYESTYEYEYDDDAEGAAAAARGGGGEDAAGRRESAE